MTHHSVTISLVPPEYLFLEYYDRMTNVYWWIMPILHFLALFSNLWNLRYSYLFANQEINIAYDSVL